MTKSNLTSFEPISKSDWLQKIIRDLKEDDVKDFLVSYGNDIYLDPFVHSEDLSNDLYNELIFSRQGHSIPMQRISTDKLDPLHALQNGAGALLVAGELKNEINLSQVDQDMAPTYFQDDEENSGQFDLNEVDNFISNTAKWMTLNMKSPSDQALKCICKASNDFYLNIAGFRALRIVRDQLNMDLGSQFNELILIAEYDIDEKEDLAYNLQASMNTVLAAFLGGANHILSPSNIKDDHHKWYHNLVHLLTLEAELPVAKDLVTGSTLLEKLTNQISDKIWEELKKSTD